MALLAVQVHSNGPRQIRKVVVRSAGGCVKDVYEGDPDYYTISKNPIRIIINI